MLLKEKEETVPNTDQAEVKLISGLEEYKQNPGAKKLAPYFLAVLEMTKKCIWHFEATFFN